MPFHRAAKPVKKPAPITRIKRARQVIQTTKRAAEEVKADQSINRSTRTRASYKVKADALDRVERILNGEAA